MRLRPQINTEYSEDAFFVYKNGEILENYLEKNIKKIKNSIPENVEIVAAVKYASKEQIKEIIKKGIINIGFNTHQQFKEIKEIIPENAKIHFIGHLQKNKVRKVLESNVYLIQSLDSYKLAEKINRICEELQIKQNVLLQIRTDENKEHGFNLEECENAFIKIKERFPNINIVGLMTIPPLEEPEETRKYFIQLKKEYDKLKERFNQIKYLSIGMSNDYKIAAEEGANMVRIGRSIFENQ